MMDWLQWLMVLVLAVAIAVLALHQLRLRTLSEVNRRLEKLVEERTRDLQQQVARTEAALVDAASARDEQMTLNLQLQQASELKSELLNIAAHDLKNPLSGIIGLTQLMWKQADPESSYGHKLAIIGSTARQMLALINGLLDVSRLESGKLHLEMQSLELRALVQTVLDEYRLAAEIKSQSFAFKADSAITVQADRERLRQVIANLVSNAVKFSPYGGIVDVRLSSDSQWVRLEVQDHGPGLNEHDLSLVFGRFQRLSARPTGGETSTGLGLSIAQQLVSLHGGRIWVESEVGSGSVFVVELPLAVQLGEETTVG